MKTAVILSAMCAVAALAGCSGGGSGGDQGSLTKDEARRTGGKGDNNVDYCELFGWYGDGVCDDFCPRADEDCDTVRTCGGRLGLTCQDGEFCRYDREAICGASDQLGLCTTTPEVCTQEYAPVCGCDRQTYSNECSANAAGTSAASDGSCAPQCDTDEDCPQLVCIPEGPCPQTRCVDGECRVPEQPCGGIAGLTCGDDSYCDFGEGDMCGGADQMGVCHARPEACTEEYDPVCGCDGETYGNACSAHSAGVDDASTGECPGPIAGRCGGIVGLTCQENEYCDYDDDQSCGAGDQMGNCVTRPEVCTQEYDPVCGCDGETYNNSCVAHSRGADDASAGECAVSDCRTDGCSQGRYCSYCWGNWACIPDGALC